MSAPRNGFDDDELLPAAGSGDPRRTEAGSGDPRRTPGAAGGAGLASSMLGSTALCLGLVALAAGLGVGYVFWLEPKLKGAGKASQRPVIPGGSGTRLSTPFICKGVERPPTVSAAEARLSDDAEVFGIVAKGKPRAYAVKQMQTMTTHVVNDFVNGMPVTLAYCPSRNCVRGFTAEGVNRPLRVNLGGWMAGRQVLCVDTGFYFQETSIPLSDNFPPLPYTNIEVTRTTWKSWRQAHPDTDVSEDFRRKGMGG